MKPKQTAEQILYEFTNRNYNNIELPARDVFRLAQAYLDLLEAQKKYASVREGNDDEG